jgi:hypothetical protein
VAKSAYKYHADGVWDADGPAEWSGKEELTDGSVFLQQLDIFRHLYHYTLGFYFATTIVLGLDRCIF